MKTIVQNLARALLTAAAALGAAQPQSTSHEVSLVDIMAQQPQETIAASAPCQRSGKDQYQTYPIDPKTLVPDMNTLMEMSDEVILAGYLRHAAVLSPSGESVATYFQVKVIRSWKGSHQDGDTLTFGIPVGMIHCDPAPPFHGPTFWVHAGDFTDFTLAPESVYVLFLRQSKGNETQWIQGLRLAAGGGVQGIFQIDVPENRYGSKPPTDCNQVGNWSVQRCDAYLETSPSPVTVPYVHDPLKKRYDGTPVPAFLRDVQSVAAAQGLAEKSPSR